MYIGGKIASDEVSLQDFPKYLRINHNKGHHKTEQLFVALISRLNDESKPGFQPFEQALYMLENNWVSVASVCSNNSFYDICNGLTRNDIYFSKPLLMLFINKMDREIELGNIDDDKPVESYPFLYPLISLIFADVANYRHRHSDYIECIEWYFDAHQEVEEYFLGNGVSEQDQVKRKLYQNWVAKKVALQNDADLPKQRPVL